MQKIFQHALKAPLRKILFLTEEEMFRVLSLMGVTGIGAQKVEAPGRMYYGLPYSFIRFLMVNQ